MSKLVQYEFKKIIKNKVNIILFCIMLLLVLYAFVPDMIRYHVTTEDSERLQGREAVRYEQAYLDAAFDKPLTSEQISEDIAILRQLIGETTEEFYDPEKFMDEEVYEAYFLPRGDYYAWLTESYEGLNDKTYWATSDLINYSHPFPDFYEFRAQKAKANIDNSQVVQDHPQEVNYWQDRVTLTNGPYAYGYHAGWSSINDTLDLYAFLLLIVVAVSLSGVFARENESNMISIVLSSQYGVKKLAKAKMIAAAVYVLLLSLVMLTVITVPNLLFYGTDGWDLPVQILSTKILYPWNLLDLYLVRVLMSLLTALSFGAACLFFSALTKRTYVVNVIAMGLTFAMFLLPDIRKRLFVQIAMLLPLQLNGVLYYSYISYPLLGKILNIYQVAPMLHLLCIAIFTWAAMAIFNRQEVS